MKTAVVILNWNTKDYLRTFLPPLLAGASSCDAEVIVADNASTDGSVEMLHSKFPGVRTIVLDRNYGFTGGYDRAVARLLDAPDGDAPEYVLLLNSDILAEGDWLVPLTAYMDSHPECAVCGPKIHRLVPDGDGWRKSGQFEYAGAAGGYIDKYGFPFCRGRVLSRIEEDSGQYDAAPRQVFWISGACMMTRSRVWKELGGLDERFFAHMEEIDYCWRAALKGHEICVVPDSCVYHIGGGTLARTSSMKLKLNYRNSLLMMEKNLEACMSPEKAASVLRRRMWIDRFTQAAYLLAGKSEAAGAVSKAHREFRSMRGDSVKSPAGKRPYGFFGIRIILQYALRGKGVFKYLRNYENCH